jgi:hypothetical protein
MEPGSENRTQHKLVDIDLSPEFQKSDFLPSTNIANGTKVSIQDAQHLPHEWRDGNVVPVVDMKLMGSHKSISFLTVGFGIVLLSIAVYLRYKKSSS